MNSRFSQMRHSQTSRQQTEKQFPEKRVTLQFSVLLFLLIGVTALQWVIRETPVPKRPT